MEFLKRKSGFWILYQVQKLAIHLLFQNTSRADTCKNCAKRGKGFKIGTNEAYNIKIKISVGGTLKIFCFCSYTNMAASDKVISLNRKILEKVFT